jgi:hypothetical protein
VYLLLKSFALFDDRDDEKNLLTEREAPIERHSLPPAGAMNAHTTPEERVVDLVTVRWPAVVNELGRILARPRPPRRRSNRSEARANRTTFDRSSRIGRTDLFSPAAALRPTPRVLPPFD